MKRQGRLCATFPSKRTDTIFPAIAPWPLGLAGPIYGIAATLLSLVFAILSLQVLANPATEPAGMKPEKRLFAFSILYLFAIFGMLVADRWLLA